MKKTNSKKINYIVHPQTDEQKKKNPVVLRIIISSEHTRIDFGYAAPWIYIKGGWIKIAPYTFIEVCGTKKRYHLKKTWNIPFAPEIFEFETNEDWKVFSLYFEPIPIKDCSINIIEEENPNDDDFNYYNIALKNIEQIELIE